MRPARDLVFWLGLSALVLAGCGGPPAAPGPAEPAATPPDGLEFVPPPPGTYDLPAIQAAADGVVVDADGTTRRLFDYLGDRYVLLSFIYSRCTNPKGCPLATMTLRRIESGLRADPELAAQTRLLSLSFDPEHDTPDLMLRFAAEDYLDTRWDQRQWSFLTTASRLDLQPILDGYGQYIVRELDESGKETGDLSHVLKVFLIDRERRVRNIYSSDYIHPDLAINDLRTLIGQQAERL